ANLTRKPPQKPLGATGKSMARSDYGEPRAAVAPATNSHSEEDIMRTAASRNGTAAAPTNPESSRDLSTKRRRTTAKAWAKQVTETEATEGQLALLSARANDQHWKYHHGHRAALSHAKESGQALIEAKQLAGHGNWYKWLASNFDASVDTAEDYMRVARHWQSLQALLDRDPKMSINEAKQRIRDMEARRKGNPTSTYNPNDSRRDPPRAESKRIKVET